MEKSNRSIANQQHTIKNQKNNYKSENSLTLEDVIENTMDCCQVGARGNAPRRPPGQNITYKLFKNHK